MEFTETRSAVVLLGDGVLVAGQWETRLPDSHVRVLAREGARTEDLLEMRSELLELRPAVVVVQGGVADFQLRRSVEHVVRNLELLMVAIRRDHPGARMLVQAILPLETSSIADVQDANRHLRQFSHTVGAQYLDLDSSLLEGGQLRAEFSDGVAMNETGYEAWAIELRSAIEALESAPPMTRPIQLIPSPA